jgi:hypothetical protein
MDWRLGHMVELLPCKCKSLSSNLSPTKKRISYGRRVHIASGFNTGRCWEGGPCGEGMGALPLHPGLSMSIMDTQLVSDVKY